MTNEEIIMEEATELMEDGILAGTLEKIDICGEEEEVMIPEEIHTFDQWKKLGRIVKKGEHAIAKFAIWSPTKRTQKMLDDNNGKVDDKKKKELKMYMRNASWFKFDQTQPIEEAEKEYKERAAKRAEVKKTAEKPKTTTKSKTTKKSTTATKKTTKTAKTSAKAEPKKTAPKKSEAKTTKKTTKKAETKPTAKKTTTKKTTAKTAKKTAEPKKTVKAEPKKSEEKKTPKKIKNTTYGYDGVKYVAKNVNVGENYSFI